jgi:hypothetical protein
MQATEFVAVLEAMRPRVALVAGCYLVDSDDRRRPAEWVAGQLDSPLYRGDVRRYEREQNRMFVIAGLLDRLENADACTVDQLLAVAELYAAWLRHVLAATFPQQPFIVQTRGAGLVDNEPLELCVTFSRAST